MAVRDNVRRSGGNAEKQNIVSGQTTYTFKKNIVGAALYAEDGTKRYFDTMVDGNHLFGYVNKTDSSDRYSSYGTNGWFSCSNKTITISSYTSGYVMAYFE